MTAEQKTIEELSVMHGRQMALSYQLAYQLDEMTKEQEAMRQRIEALEKENAELIALLDEYTGGNNHE